MKRGSQITNEEGEEALRQLRAGARRVDVAREIHVSPRVLRRWLAVNGRGNVLRRITDVEVAIAIRSFLVRNVRFGETYCHSELLRQGYRVPWEQMRRVLRIVDPQGILARTHAAIPRCEAEWHASGYMYSSDGLDKNLPTYGLHINSLIDNWSKMILSARVDSDKFATTVMDAHKPALKKYGWSRFWRTDAGTENNGVIEAQNFARGAGSAIVGRSVNNIVIERANKELQKAFAHFQSFHKRVLKPLEMDIKDLRTKTVIHHLFKPLFQLYLDEVRTQTCACANDDTHALTYEGTRNETHQYTQHTQFVEVWNLHTMKNKKKKGVSPLLAFRRDAANNRALPFVDGDANDLRFEAIKRGFAQQYDHNRVYLLTEAEEDDFRQQVRPLGKHEHEDTWLGRINDAFAVVDFIISNRD